MSPRLRLAALVLAFLCACRHDTPPLPPQALEARYPAAGRVVAIGDLHGDADAARAALRLAGAIDGADRWIGGSLVVVQTGDQLDRGDQEQELLDLLERLGREARAAGGALRVLNGNHELMNVRGDFGSVSEEGMRDFEDVAVRSPLAEAAPERERGRAAAFLPGGEYARRFARRDVVAVVGDTVFVHGGLHPEHLAYGLDRLNGEVRAWIDGRGEEPKAVRDRSSPLWTRRYSQGQPSARECLELERVLAALGARRMVVGHTMQKGGITSACAGTAWRIDVGLSRVYGKRPIEVLEIAPGQVRALGAPREAPAAIAR